MSVDRIAHYEITGKLGAGGMGEVYRATDTKLNREVALKILPEEFAADPQRMARFQREAEVLASLDHPNIGTIYGIEKAGETHALVLQLIEGPTLADRIAEGPIPLDNALGIAGQLAEALDAAHEKGVVHRDLKPANIKLTPEGQVKVLDFGLARTGPSADTEQSTPDLTTSPTLTQAATQAGVILGTAAYMSPEQAKGKAVDKRADIWSFGVILFEMLSGRAPFEGEDFSEILAAVVATSPDLTALPKSTSPAAVQLIRRCLERDPVKRLRDIGDARYELESLSTEDQGRREAVARFASPAAAGLITILALAVVALGVFPWGGSGEGTIAGVTRVSIALPPGHALVAGPEISRDGRRIAFVSSDNVERPLIYTRLLKEAELRPLAGTEDADHIFFSPDGRWIAYYAQAELFKVNVDGGAPVALADAPSSLGGFWLEDGTILFTPAWNAGLFRINENGGEPEPVLVPDRVAEYAFTWPHVLPGDDKLLFGEWGADIGLRLLDLSTLSRTNVADGLWRRSAVVQTGHILTTGHSGDLLALPPEALETPNLTAEPLIGHVHNGQHNGYSHFSVSSEGTLVYAPLNLSRRELVVVDQTGDHEPLPGEPTSYESIALSPDESRIVYMDGFELFIRDLARGSRLPLTHELEGSAHNGIWSVDGSRIIFSSNHDGDWDVYSTDPAQSDEPEVVLQEKYDQNPMDMAPDGTLVYRESHPETGEDIWLLPPGPAGQPRPWLVTPASEGDARVSPDGKLMAFRSRVSGRNEIYVSPLAEPSRRVAVSTSGGRSPAWAPSGQQLFFRNGNRILLSDITGLPELTAGEPRLLFDGGWQLSNLTSWFYYNYAPMADGRLLMVYHHPEALPTRIHVIFNFLEELKRRMPAD